MQQDITWREAAPLSLEDDQAREDLLSSLAAEAGEEDLDDARTGG